MTFGQNDPENGAGAARRCRWLPWLLLAPGAAWAFFPLLTEDAGTLDAGGNQIELSYTGARASAWSFSETGERAGRERERSGSQTLTYTRGLAAGLEAYVAVARQHEPAGGWTSPQLGLKWRWLGNGETGFSLALKPALTLPLSRGAARAGLGSSHLNWGLTLAGSYMAMDFELHAAAAYLSNRRAPLPGEAPERRHLWSVSAAPVWVVSPRWKLSLEAGAQSAADRDERLRVFGQAAALYRPVPSVQLGAGVMVAAGVGGVRGARALTVTAGLDWEF